MSRLITGAAITLAALTAPAHALDLSGDALSGGTLRGTEVEAPTDWDELASLDIGERAARAATSADDQLDALAREDAASGVADAPTVPRAARRSLGGTDAPALAPDVPLVEDIPVLGSKAAAFRAHVPSPTRSLAVLPRGGWVTENPRPSTVLMGGSWTVR